MDTGAVAHVEPVPLGLNDTYGMVMQRLGQLLPRALVAFIQQLAIHGENLPCIRQKKDCHPVHSARPDDSDQAIHWEESPHRIDALVRSCNPVYHGALALFRSAPVRVISVKRLNQVSGSACPPGTFLRTDPREGITVACGGQNTLTIDILCTEGGFYSGGRFTELFDVRAGEAFAQHPSTPGQPLFDGGGHQRATRNW
jgi:methionyl-tRNA formyltransferase